MSYVLDNESEAIEPLSDLSSIMLGTESNRAILLALDIGTSGVRAALFNANGDEVSVPSVRTRHGVVDFSTADASALLGVVAGTIDALLEDAHLMGITSRIELIAVSCFWHSLVGIDEAGRATTPVLGWADNRAADAAALLRARLDEAEVHARTGCRLHQSYWPAKIVRLRDDEPHAFGATWKWLSFAEYLAFHLFGECAVSISMASGTGLLNQRSCEWDREMLEALELRVESLPEIAPAEKTFRGLTADYAARWPQLSEARMLPGIGDGAANSIGAGCTSKEKLALMIGTSGAMRMIYEGEPLSAIPPELWSYRVDRKRLIIGGALSDGGGLCDALRASLLPGIDNDSIESGLANLEPDNHGLTVLPFWAGERSTGWNLNARGAILGLSFKTTPLEVLRAVMEAIAYRFALIARALDPIASGARIIASGNALHSSPTWLQILADVLGREVSLSETAEASLRGAALLALESMGKIPDISFQPEMVPVLLIAEPDLARHAIYQAGLERQQRMYERVINCSDRTVK